MATTAAHFLAFLALVMNSALMVPCACCLGVELKTDACCTTEVEAVAQAAPCCSGSCCSTSHDEPTLPSLERGSSLLPCLDGSTTAICCCNDAQTAAVTPPSSQTEHISDSIDNAPVLPMALTSLVDITHLASQPDSRLERSLITSRSPCALLQLHCVWLK
ncbi:hypothetical protein [Lacunimicrobium album]